MTATNMIKLLILVSVLSVTYSHTCLVFPVQRGGLNNSLSIKGSTACGKLKSPCGDSSVNRNPVPVFYTGKTYSIVFQKNLDHYYAANPGFFEIRITDESNEFNDAAIVPDRPTFGDLSILTVNVTIPREVNITPGSRLLQLRYQTNNPEAPANFYQCADMEVRNLST